jgi:hypothetical protein
MKLVARFSVISVVGEDACVFIKVIRPVRFGKSRVEDNKQAVAIVAPFFILESNAIEMLLDINSIRWNLRRRRNQFGFPLFDASRLHP